MSDNSLNDNTPIDWEASYKRALADLTNQEKDFAQRSVHLIQFANLDLLKKLIPLFESVCAAASQNDEFTPIKKQFENMFELIGVKRIKTLGQTFDPLYHEAIDKRHEEGSAPHLILEEISPGYLYHDKVLKPAKVIVSI